MWPSGLYKIEGSNKLGIEEFRKIFLDLYPDLCLYAFKFVGDYDSSKDIVQEVLTQFWVENEKLLNKNLLKPYLFKSVKNRALNFSKREKRSTGLDEWIKLQNLDLADQNSSDAIDKIAFSDLQNDMEKAIEELPEQRRKIFRMSRYENLKHKEIAESLKISPKTVETQIYRSLTFLRKKLKHYLD